MAKNTDNKNDDLFNNEKPINHIEERNHLLRDMPYKTVRRAWFTLSHLLLEDGAKVMDMECGDGMLTYVMAALNPKIHFIGVDKSKKNTTAANEKYQAPNLEYMVGDISGDLLEPESVDAIINSFTLHKVFSNARYNEKIVSDTLRKQFTMLKNGGLMFIRDYPKPPPHDFVMIEMHDKESSGDAVSELSEVDLLIWYSEHARPKQDPGCGGFFLEELPPRFPRTRLFRLPYKWAYEFIMRKDDRDIWEANLPFEYTFYTTDDFRKELQNLGARVEYSAPHWDEDYIRKNFEGHFRLLKSNSEQIGDPPTSFIAIARKQPDKTSLDVKERRVTKAEKPTLEVKTLRNQKNGVMVDVITRNKEWAEILPYRISDDGILYIYLHEGVIRGIVNTVERSGNNIDGREWSGHMLETISTEYTHIQDIGEITAENSHEFIQNNIGLTCIKDALLEEGHKYYPDPNYIDERIHTYYISVQDINAKPEPKSIILESQNFENKGTIRELKAQQVLDSLSVGLFPNSRLELQILSLMQHTKIKAENWIRKDIAIASGEITKNFEIRHFLREASHSDKRFKEVKTSAGQLRTINSIFVEEGQSQGGRTGLSSETIDFVVSDKKTLNTAVILPITSSVRGDVHAGFTIKHMPIPQRFEGNGISLSMPQINIPKEITNLRMLKQFIAEKFGVTPNMVLKLGESFYSHIGITPERIHPFAISAPPAMFKDPQTRFMPIYQYMLLWKSLSKEQHFMTTIARAYRFLPGHLKMNMKRESLLILDTIFKTAQPDWSLPSVVVPEGSQAKKQDTPEIPKAKQDEKPLSAPKRETAAEKAERQRQERRKKRLLGLATQDQDSEHNDGADPTDSDSLETANKKKHIIKHIDINLIEDFQREIDAIKQVLDEEMDNKPKPEKW